MNVLTAKEKNLIKKIITLYREDKLEEGEALIEAKLQNEPNNIEWWLRLAILVEGAPIADNLKSIACAEKALLINPEYPLAILLLAVFQFLWNGSIEESLAYKLETTYTDSAEMNSMFRYIASWFFWRTENKQREEELLKESIELYNGHVFNYKHLAHLYVSQGKKSEAKELAKKALKSVKESLCEGGAWTEDYDPTDIEGFLDNRIKGTRIAKVLVDGIKEDFGLE